MSHDKSDHERTLAAVRTLTDLGYGHEGGVRWRPLLGRRPDFDRIDRRQREIDALHAMLTEWNQRIAR